MSKKNPNPHRLQHCLPTVPAWYLWELEEIITKEDPVPAEALPGYIMRCLAKLDSIVHWQDRTKLRMMLALATEKINRGTQV